MSDGGKTRAGSSKSLTGSLSKILMGSSGKKSSKKSSKRSSGGNKKYMGFTMTQILVGAAVVGGIYYYKEGFSAGAADTEFKAACQKAVQGGGSDDAPPPLNPDGSTNVQATAGAWEKFERATGSAPAPAELNVHKLPSLLKPRQELKGESKPLVSAGG